MKPLVVLASIALSTISMSCGLLNSTLTGDVFVVTKAHESIRLGLVTVSAIDRDAMREHLRNRKALWISGPGKVIAQEREDISKRFDAATRRYNEADDYDSRTAASAEVDEVSKRILELYEKSPFDPPLDYYFANAPKPVSSATTDADGRFRLKIPRGRSVLICAITSRQTLDGQEWLAWACPPPAGGESGYHLSSDNMLEDEELALLLRTSVK